MKMLINTLKKLVNLNAVNSLGSEIGKTMTNVKIKTQKICPDIDVSHQLGSFLPRGFIAYPITLGIIVLKRTIYDTVNPMLHAIIQILVNTCPFFPKHAIAISS